MQPIRRALSRRMLFRAAMQGIVLLLLGGCQVTLEGFQGIVTKVDRGFNDFSGNVGDINKDGLHYGESSLVCPGSLPCVLHFAWDFSTFTDQEALTGVFASLFGLTKTRATFDGATIEDKEFPEQSLDLDHIHGALNEPGGL